MSHDAHEAVTSDQPVEVVVYSKEHCVQCKATYRALDSKNIEYTIIDLSDDESAVATLKDLGYLTAPVVVAGDDHWGGFRPDKIDTLSASFQAA